MLPVTLKTKSGSLRVDVETKHGFIFYYSTVLVTTAVARAGEVITGIDDNLKGVACTLTRAIPVKNWDEPSQAILKSWLE